MQNMHCTPFISLTLTDKNVIMHEMMPFKQRVFYKNNYKQIDCINDMLMIMTMFSQLLAESAKLAMKHKIH